MVRVKHRYLISQVMLDNSSVQVESFQGRDVLGSIREKVQALYGDVGAGEFGTNMTLRYFDGNLETGSLILVIRTPRDGEMQTRFAMTAVNTIKQNNVCIRSLATCGSARTAMAKLTELLSKAKGREIKEGGDHLKDVDL